MKTIRIERPVPLEQKEITDAIDELQKAKASVEKTSAPENCKAHGAIAQANTANIKANILSLRLQENILFIMQNGSPDNGGNYLRFGKLQAGGLAAIVIAIVIAFLLFSNLISLDFGSSDSPEGTTNEHIQ